MSECGNVFENFIANFYVKFGKLQIRGFHGKIGVPSFNNHRTVSPTKQRMMSNMKGSAGDDGAYHTAYNNSSHIVRDHAYGG